MANSVDPDLEQFDLGTHYLTSLSENFCLSLIFLSSLGQPGGHLTGKDMVSRVVLHLKLLFNVTII